MTRNKALMVGLIVAQTWIPQQQACDGRRTPAPGADPWANVPISETATTEDGVRIGVQVLFTGLTLPWSMVFTPDGRMFFTERIGRVRVVQNGQLLPQPAFTFSDVFSSSESGALGIALHPNFAQNRLVFVAYTAQKPNLDVVTRVVRFREVNNTFAEAAVIVDEIPGAAAHVGSRLRFGPDGKLWLTTGDAGHPEYSQTLSLLAGKILRYNEDGTTPADNPYGSPIWSWGHRHPQGIDWHPATGQLWSTEHGGAHRDELNRIVKGANYGWPVIQGDEARPDMVTPVLFFVPAVAPSGMSFYSSTRIPQFRANIFFATLAGQHIHRVRLDPTDSTKVLAHESLFFGRFRRVRDIITGPDGFLYFSTSNRDGRIDVDAVDDRIARIVPIQ